MLSGSPPIKAKKARYYADPRLHARILPPPLAGWAKPEGPKSDDWSAIPSIKPIKKKRKARVVDDAANGGSRGDVLSTACAAPRCVRHLALRLGTSFCHRHGDRASSSSLSILSAPSSSSPCQGIIPPKRRRIWSHNSSHNSAGIQAIQGDRTRTCYKINH